MAGPTLLADFSDDRCASRPAAGIGCVRGLRTGDSMHGLHDSFGLAPDAGAHTRFDQVWAEYCARIGVPPAERASAAAVSRAVAQSAASADLLRASISVLLQFADGVGVDGAADRLVPFISGVMARLPPDAAERIVSGMEVPERKRFVRATVPVLGTAAVLIVVRATAASYNAPLSAPLRRLLVKLRSEADTLDAELGARANQAFRSLVLHLEASWSATAISTGTESYDSMFGERQERRRTRVTPEPLRVIQLSLESGAMGNVVWTAVGEQAQDDAGMRELLNLIKQAPAGSQAAALITGQIGTPARLTMLLREEPVDFEAVGALASSMGTAAVRPLLDELVEAKHRGTRRAIMDRLVKLGAGICPYVAERLDDRRWYVARNMVALLREAGCGTGQLSLDPLRSHEDARVRREVLQLDLETGDRRDEALTAALRDTDRNVLRSALQAARTRLPAAAVTVLASRVMESTYPPEFRVMSLFLLGRSASPQALETLLAYAQGGRTLLGKPKLAPKSAEMLAALGGLARSGSSDRRVAVLLDLARRSGDEQILNALQASGAQ